MKKYIYILMAGISLLALSCKKEYVNPYADAEKGSSAIKIVKSQLEYTPEASTGIVEVDAEGTITATSDRDWCAVSVSGKQITLSLTANADKETRYALLTIAAGKYTTALSVFQYGEVLAGLDALSDITANVEGEEIHVPIKANVSIEFEETDSWVHPHATAEELVINVDANPDPKTRFCTVKYTAGSKRGSFDVTQLPELKKEDNWAFGTPATTFKYPNFNVESSMTAADTDMYVTFLLSSSTVEEKDLPDYIFSTLAVKARRDILDQVTAQPETAFTDYLQKGSSTSTFKDVTIGKNYLIAVGFADNGFVSGRYQYSSVTIDDIRPAYYKWAGKWTLSGKNIEGNAYTETIEITVDESDVDGEGNLKEAYLLVTGLCSKNQTAAEVADPEVGKMRLIYTVDDESITFYGQDGTKTFTNSTYGSGAKMQLISMYVKAGATAYTNTTGGRFLKAQMDADGKTTTLTALERSAGLPYKAFRMRLLNAAGSAYTMGGNAATIAIDSNLTLTRAN